MGPHHCAYNQLYGGEPIMSRSFGEDLGDAVKEDLLAMQVDVVPVSAAGANSFCIDGFFNIS